MLIDTPTVPDGRPMRLPRPTGPFRLRQGTGAQVGYQYHEIAAVKMGGDPTAYSSKIRLLTADHVTVGSFWRRIQALTQSLLAKPGECQHGSGGVDGGVG